MRYIATREGVEKLAGNGAVTKGQRELIQKLLTDFPDAVELFEYEDYCKTPTLGTASAFITMALDANLHGIDSESGYMQYIATRPRVQKHGSHGLFSSSTSVDLASAMSELESHEGNVWTIIYSLRREDAARLEFDNADAWRTLLMENAPTLAKSMKISLDNFHWYAAFHDEGHHPHIHMMVWSDDPKEGFLTKDGIAAMRSKLTNAIFRDEMQQIYERKDVACCGTSIQPVLQMLEQAPQLDTVLLCLDNDEAGNQASRRMQNQLEVRYSVERLIPENKDWNDDLTLSGENAQGLAMNEMR